MKEIDALVAKLMGDLVLTSGYSERVIRSALMEARALGLEEAASMAERYGGPSYQAYKRIADAIRARKGE